MITYLATVRLYTSEYMGKSRYSTVFRLVIASNEDTARALVKRAYTVEDPYGEDVSVEDVELSPAIVEGQ